MNVTVDVEGQAALEENLSALSDYDYIGTASNAVYHFLVDYHQNFDWRGPRWMPGPNSGQFQQQVVKGWQPPQIAGDSAEITNTFGLLAWKLTGGTITPKTAKMLTIPLTTAAKGQPAPQWPGPGKLIRIGNTLSVTQRTGFVSPQYALKQSVTQTPWPGAMPDSDAMSDAAASAVSEAIDKVVTGT